MTSIAELSLWADAFLQEVNCSTQIELSQTTTIYSQTASEIEEPTQ